VSKWLNHERKMDNTSLIEYDNLYPRIKGFNRMTGFICDINGVSQTIRANSGGNTEVKIAEPIGQNEVVVETSVRYRKVTPKECWRLMGFDDGSFERAAQVNSNSQLYKQAGNSIVVNVLMAIFGQMIQKEGETD